MSVEKNREIALAYLRVNHEKNVPIAEEFVTDDCQFWAPGFGTQTKTQFRDMYEKMKHLLAAIPKLHILNTTAEGNRVAVEARGEGKMANGQPYNNTYHFLFVFRDGRICEIREHADTKYAADLVTAGEK